MASQPSGFLPTCDPAVVTEILHLRSIAPATASPFDRRYERGSPRSTATKRFVRRADGAALAQPPNDRAVLPAGSTDCAKEGHSVESAIPVCQRCGRKMTLVALPDGIEAATWRCPVCDCLDPLKSKRVEGWIRSSLRPPA